MALRRKDPAALAGAHRVEVTQLAGKNDFSQSTPSTLDLQVRRVLAVAPVSRSLAKVIAALAFSSGRAA